MTGPTPDPRLENSSGRPWGSLSAPAPGAPALALSEAPAGGAGNDLDGRLALGTWQPRKAPGWSTDGTGDISFIGVLLARFANLRFRSGRARGVPPRGGGARRAELRAVGRA